MTPGPGIEPRTHWWEASALITAPPLLPLVPVLTLIALINQCDKLFSLFIFESNPIVTIPRADYFCKKKKKKKKVSGSAPPAGHPKIAKFHTLKYGASLPKGSWEAICWLQLTS